MSFEFKPDYEQTRQRIEAFWENDVLDRPLVMIPVPKGMDEWIDGPVSNHQSPEERWMDAQYQAESALVAMSNTQFLGDALPIAYPNLGPEVFSGFYGCKLHFGDYGTSWSDPCLDDWSQADALCLNWDSIYMKKLVEMTDALLEVGKDKFIVGMADWHPGGDALAAFRDPAELAVDMKLHKEEVMKLLKRVEADYFAVYDFFYNKLRAAGQPITSWTPLVSESKYYIPSNDFSIMISKAMYDEVFLPGMIRECQFYDRSIYHLDGLGALRHLSSILSINELHALQWVPGSGNEGFTRWIEVYQTTQAAGKGIQVNCTVDEVPDVMEYVSPKGLFMQVGGVGDADTANNILRAMERWTAEQR
jgi:hypothetical protein